jgi:hypothetical protein
LYEQGKAKYRTTMKWFSVFIFNNHFNKTDTYFRLFALF